MLPRRWREPSDDRFHPGEKLEHAHRLDDVIVGADPKALHLVHLLIARGKNEHRGRSAARAVAPEHLEAVHTGEHQIENDQVGIVALEPGKPGVSIGDALNLVSLDLETGAKAEREGLVVLENEDRPIDRIVASGWVPGVSHWCVPLVLRWSVRVKRVPPSGMVARSASPPIAVARSRTIASPSPAPPVLSSRLSFPRTNASHTFSR